MASLQKYSGQWSNRTAAHLLRRTTFGTPYEIIKEMGRQNVDEVVNRILTPVLAASPPINENSDNDPDVPIGATWVNAPFTQGTNNYRNQSLLRWSFDLMMDTEPNIREKMTLFWHNHFVIAQSNDARYSYIYIEKLRNNCLGDFKQMTKDMTIDPAMLIYLNGNENSRQAPNENYARELLELFTVGKGDLAGPGDYTTFTEDDVREMAKSLTGWVINRAQLQSTGIYRPNRHDIGSKQLSHRFGNKVIENGNENEYSHLIDVIFENDSVATHIVTKIYRWFVHHDITPVIQQNIIQPLAKIFRENNYQIKPVLESLLKSEHFYDDCVHGVMIKSPLDILLNPLCYFKPIYPQNVNQKISRLNELYGFSFALGMGIFNAPDVAGWQPYYQEPSFDRLWLNSNSLPNRKLYSDAICSIGIGPNNVNNRLSLDLLETIEKFEKPDNAELVIAELSLMMFPKPLAQNQIDTLLNIINFGQTNGWSLAYQAYQAAPDVERNRNAVINLVRATLVYMTRMPEYTLS